MQERKSGNLRVGKNLRKQFFMGAQIFLSAVSSNAVIKRCHQMQSSGDKTFRRQEYLRSAAHLWGVKEERQATKNRPFKQRWKGGLSRTEAQCEKRITSSSQRLF
jgi:hypothetical protein